MNWRQTTIAGAALRRLGWLAAGLALLPAALHAESEQGYFEVRSVYAEHRNGVYFLNGRINYQLGSAAREALHSGVPLEFELEIELNRKRRWMPDSEVALLLQVNQLEFHALTQRYLVRNINSGEQASFATLADALEEVGQIRQLPLIDESLLEADKPYEVSLRTVLELRDLPSAVRWLAFWWGDLRTASDWYTWPLRP